MRRLLKIVGTAAFVACGVVACGLVSTAPTATDMVGKWSGTILSNQSGSGTMVFTLVRSDSSSVSGIWSTSFANTANNDSGSMSGTIVGSGLSFILTPSNPNVCPFNATATLNGAMSMSGMYAAVNCTVAASGTFTVAKQ